MMRKGRWIWLLGFFFVALAAASPQDVRVTISRTEVVEIITELQRRRIENTKLRADVVALQRTLGIEKSACASRILSEQLRTAEIKKVCHEATQCTAWKVGIGVCVGVGLGLGVAGFQIGRSFK